jgi:hypothetical protein
LITPFVTQAATITTCTFDKETYHQGQPGPITVTIYHDKDHKIRVTELTATIEYYYTDGNVYIQSFFTDATLPAEIQQGQSSIFHIPFSLPTNVATGYTDIYVKAKTELWSMEAERWVWSDHPTYQPTLYIESPYKQQSEQRLLMMYLFGVATIVLAVVTVFLWMFKRRLSFIKQPIVQ